MVAINPAQTVRCKKKLEGSPVHVGAAIGFPLGQTTLECKIFETKDAIEKGADEIDYVINVAELKNKNYDYIKKEMEEIVKICREAGKTSKVIFENCYLTDDEKRKVAEIAKEVKPDFIKTSTGFGTRKENNFMLSKYKLNQLYFKDTQFAKIRFAKLIF